MSWAMALSLNGAKECLSRRKDAVPYIWKGKIAGGSCGTIEAAINRESTSGRVADMYQNNERMFSTCRFYINTTRHFQRRPGCN